VDPSHDTGRTVETMCADMVRYHASLRRSLPRIRESLANLSAGDASPAVDLMRAAFTSLADMLESHLNKEENLLFPAVSVLSEAERTGRGRPALPFATLLYPIRMMEAEHLRIERALDILRDFAADAAATPASPQWRRCLGELCHLDEELRSHDRFENEVLFPVALELERRVV
jgi:regulator of cell morphogenesis and NO signaling